MVIRTDLFIYKSAKADIGSRSCINAYRVRVGFTARGIFQELDRVIAPLQPW